jgi:DNA repair exonuclease SbcCD nuclease subunit
MRICILGDTHLGVRSGSNHFAEFQIRFFRDFLFPYMKEHSIDQIIQTGDLWDNRTQLQLKSYHKIKPAIFDGLRENGFKFHTIIGNHDITLRDSLKYNTSELLLGEYIADGTVVVYSEPTTVKFGPMSIDLVPWICSENYNTVHKFIKRKTPSEVCIGHFEIDGALMQRGIPGHGGLAADVFKNYDSILSGHYHTRSMLDDNRINYVGTPYELNYGDAMDPRGITILDTDTMTYEFVKNPEVMFIKLRYNSGCNIDTATLTNKFVKIIVESKRDPVEFDNFINTVKLSNPYDLAIIENKLDLSSGEIDESIEVHDTNTIIDQYIDGLVIGIDRAAVKSYMSSLYLEAVNT